MKDCQGKVFKALVSNLLFSHGLSFTVHLTVTKRHSCPGCPACDWQFDALNEVGNDWPIIGIEKAVNGAFYRIDICNVTRDYEMGIADGWDLCLVEYLPPLADSEATDLATLLEMAE